MSREPLSGLPQPRGQSPLGHLPRWGADPLDLLDEGAQLALPEKLFKLWLGQHAVLGFGASWNRLLLSDLDTFRSRRSVSALVPYLAGGIILTDAPDHRPRRQALNPGFSRASMAHLNEQLCQAKPVWPQGPFEVLTWADRAVQDLLNAAYFSGRFDQDLLHAFLAPLRQPLPMPLLPRPRLFRQFSVEVLRLARQPRPDLLGTLWAHPNALEEVRVSLAAAHDTTTHALAYAVWHLAKFPQWHAPEHHGAVLKEVLRLYPPGWVGSRRTSRALHFAGVTIPENTLVLYSPYLSGRDAEVWDSPTAFRPERWQAPPPAWTFLPFGGGERTCLGLHLAQHLILTTLRDMPPLRARWGQDSPHCGLTLGPRGPLWAEGMTDWRADA